ncbi:MAG: citramalate synthase [Planctomycetota bacterium]|jgi:2-isopropylmalate synthase|nr:citramalate synthase [Planctomycetota bacterium]
MPGRQPVLVYDTTLRDGAQGEGINFSLDDKLRLAGALDRLGVHYIEGGWPGSNPKDSEFFAAVRRTGRLRARLAAFGATRRVGVRAASDPNLRLLAESGADAAGVVGKAWDLHVREVLRTTREENLAMISSSIAFLKRRLAEVFFDAEHFFDGWRSDPEYALAALEAAFRAGADAAVLCDTNGGALPGEAGEAVAGVCRRFPGRLIGIHCHNDSGMAAANSVEAVLRGAGMVQGSLNGFGERAGNADLCSVLPVLELGRGRRCLGARNLRKLTDLSRFAYELANLPRRDFQPFVGASAFAHKGGLHAAGMARSPGAYETFRPEAVGNRRRVLISELSGRASLLSRFPALARNPRRQREALEAIRRLENDGYAFENADASLELLILRLLGRHQPPFRLLSFRASSEERLGGLRLSEASVKLRVGEEEFHTVSEGPHGPVSALDLALRKALIPAFGFVGALRLTDYRVHIVNAQAGSAARVRVVIQSREGREGWGTIGVSENILDASCQALVDSFQYQILRRGGRAGRGRPGARKQGLAQK